MATFGDQLSAQFTAITDVIAKIPSQIPLAISLTVISLVEQRVRPAIFSGYGKEMGGQSMWALGEALFFQLKSGVYGKAMGY